MDPLRAVSTGRRPLLAILATAVLLLLARSAWGEEAFVLDNGSVLRGTVLREEGESVEIRLSGRGMRGTVTVERSRIVQRFVTLDPNAPVAARPPGAEPSPASVARAAPTPPEDARAPALSRTAAPAAGTGAPPAPAVKSLAEEGFFERFARRASSAMPAEPGSRAFLVGLALTVLTALVALGSRMAEIDEADLGRCTVVALILGVFVGLAGSSAGAVLRADLAPLALPVALLAWAGLAAAVFRCGFGRAFTLLAFVLVAGALVLFTTGVVVTAI